MPNAIPDKSRSRLSEWISGGRRDGKSKRAREPKPLDVLRKVKTFLTSSSLFLSSFPSLPFHYFLLFNIFFVSFPFLMPRMEHP